MTNASEAVRVDKWLWAVRLFKTRTLATEACRAGHVTSDGQEVKPARAVKIGDVYNVRITPITKTVKVIAPLDRRVGAKMVEQYMEDLTPASEYLKQMAARENPLLKREKGAGRPTKRERREIEGLLGEI
jgi:ribosome-associated heat shock protein Hsp15